MSKKKEAERQTDFFDICGRCNNGCCRGARPPTSPKRRKLIEDHLRTHPLKDMKPPYFDESHYYAHPRETPEGYCIFYDQRTRKCRIHPVKPETCVAGPITFDINPKTRKLEYYLKLEKICPLAGRMHKTDTAALKKHVKSAKREIRRVVRDLEPEALRAILKIDEPDTLKVDEEKLEEEVLRKLFTKE
nr:YkgJ family cysteine cluster protein [Candidatus Njordarchaeum guaymaensis]